MASDRISSTLLGNIAELCIVSKDVYATIDGFTKIGMGPFQVFDFDSSTVTGQELGGERGTDLFRIKVAFAKQKSLAIEIMQPGGGNTPMQTYLDQNDGRQGVQHIAWDMGNVPMEERQRRMKKKGFEPVMQGCWLGKVGTCHFCFFDTLEKGIGTMFETIEFSEDWEDPEHEWYPHAPVTQSEGMTIPE